MPVYGKLYYEDSYYKLNTITKEYNKAYSVKKATGKIDPKRIGLYFDYNPLETTKILNTYNFKSILDKLIFAFYTQQPPRRVSDVYVLEITKQTDITKLVSKTNNYIIVDKKGKPTQVVYNAFKTSETYEQQNFKLNDVISDILLKYIESQQMDYKKRRFIFPRDNMTLQEKSNNFSTDIQKIFNAIYEIKDKNGKVKTSKGISVDIIREMSSSYYVKKFGLQPNKLDDIAKKQGHSLVKLREYAKNISFESDSKIYEDVKESGKQEPKKKTEPEPVIISEKPTTTRRSTRNK